MQFEWLNYLCEYYNVSEEEAIKLGTRANGRKPSLPGSKTCEPVSNMTMEDIWALKERKTEKDIFREIQSVFKKYKLQTKMSYGDTYDFK